MYFVFCLIGGDGGCLLCLGYIFDRWLFDLLVKVLLLEFFCNVLDFECLLSLRVDFEDRLKFVDIVVIVLVLLFSDCFLICYVKRKRD